MSDDWIMGKDNKQIQLFFIPHAGGSSTSFARLIDLLDERIEVIPLEYAGRGTRNKEKFITDYDVFLKDVAHQIMEKRKEELPFAVFGYSLGSSITYDLLSRHILEDYPVHIFLCARGSILYRSISQDYGKLTMEELADKLASRGDVDQRIVKNKRFLSIYMKPIHYDFIIWEQFKFLPGTIDCDASIIYSREDPVSEGVQDWSKIVTRKVHYHEFTGNHLFITKHWQEFADIVNKALEAWL